MTLLKRSRRLPVPARLAGEHVVLTRLRWRDLPLIAALPDDPAYELLLRRFTGGPRMARRWLRAALAAMRRGEEACWLIRRADTGKVIGSTRYLNVDQANARLEVGATWLVAGERGGPANAESKLLVLGYAFERLRMRRVHIQADVRNARSRAAIEALGATFEGTLRSHIVLDDGTSRDTAVYSITRDEWPRCREVILQRIAARSRPRVVAATITQPPTPQIDPGLEPMPISA